MFRLFLILVILALVPSNVRSEVSPEKLYSTTTETNRQASYAFYDSNKATVGCSWFVEEYAPGFTFSYGHRIIKTSEGVKDYKYLKDEYLIFNNPDTVYTSTKVDWTGLDGEYIIFTTKTKLVSHKVLTVFEDGSSREYISSPPHDNIYTSFAACQDALYSRW